MYHKLQAQVGNLFLPIRSIPGRRKGKGKSQAPYLPRHDQRKGKKFTILVE